VWGCFAGHAVGRTHRVVGIMDKHVLNKILINVVKASCDELFPDDGYMLQQDIDPKHTAIINKRYIEDNLNLLD
jgi:hypothetical protein